MDFPKFLANLVYNKVNKYIYTNMTKKSFFIHVWAIKDLERTKIVLKYSVFKPLSFNKNGLPSFWQIWLRFWKFKNSNLEEKARFQDVWCYYLSFSGSQVTLRGSDDFKTLLHVYWDTLNLSRLNTYNSFNIRYSRVWWDCCDRCPGENDW